MKVTADNIRAIAREVLDESRLALAEILPDWPCRQRDMAISFPAGDVRKPRFRHRGGIAMTAFPESECTRRGWVKRFIVGSAISLTAPRWAATLLADPLPGPPRSAVLRLELADYPLMPADRRAFFVVALKLSPY